MVSRGEDKTNSPNVFMLLIADPSCTGMTERRNCSAALVVQSLSQLVAASRITAYRTEAASRSRRDRHGIVGEYRRRRRRRHGDGQA